MLKSFTVIVFALLIGHALIIHADEFEVADDLAAGTYGRLARFIQTHRASGVARTNYFHSSKSLDNETDFLGATAQIKILPELTDTVDGKIEARLTNPALNRDSDTKSRLLEAYATVHFTKADLRFGKQIVAWGRADGINPTDNLTPRDLVVLLPFEDDQRFGAVATRIDAYLSPKHTFTAFMTPFFEPSNVPFPSDDRTLTEKTPARTLANSAIGLKLDKVDEGFDGSISYFHGFSLLPNVRLLGSNSIGPILESHYDRIDVLGADFARNYGRFGLRGEAAYIHTRDDAGTDPDIKNPAVFWIAGIDRTFFENLNINVQLFERRTRRYRNPENIADLMERAIAIQNALLNGQQDKISHGISFRLSDKWFNDTLEAEVFAIVNFTRHDSFVRPLLIYAFSDHWKGILGAEFYHGAADTPFGSLKPNRGTFAELRYGF